MGRRLALLIGNSIYDDPAFPSLMKAEADVHAMEKVLGDPNIGEFEVTSLINEAVETIRQKIAAFFQQGRKDDFLFLYFSGHGDAWNKLRYLYLIGKDTKSGSFPSTAVSSSFIKEVMDLSNAKIQVLVLDCCYSGAFNQGRKGKLQANDAMASLFEGSGHAVLTASSATQPAWEGDISVPLSPFTHYLVQGLATGEADTNKRGLITLDEWYAYAYIGVTNEFSEQTPSKSIDRQQGQIVVAANPTVEKKIFGFPNNQLLTTLNVSAQKSATSQLESRPEEFALICTIKIPTGMIDGTNYLNDMVISPDGRTVLGSMKDGIIKLWNLRTGRLLGALPKKAFWEILYDHRNYNGEGRFLAISPDGQTLAGMRSLKTVQTWDLNTGRLLCTFEHLNNVQTIAISPDGQTLVSGSDDATIRLWNLYTGQFLGTLEGHRNIKNIRISSNGQILTGAASGIPVWSLQTRKLLRTLSSQEQEFVLSVAISPDGQILAGCGYKEIYIWNLQTGELLHTLKKDPCNAIAISPDGRTIVSAGNPSVRGMIDICDLRTGKLLHTLHSSNVAVYHLAFSPDGQTLAAGYGTTIEIFGKN